MIGKRIFAYPVTPFSIDRLDDLPQFSPDFKAIGCSIDIVPDNHEPIWNSPCGNDRTVNVVLFSLPEDREKIRSLKAQYKLLSEQAAKRSLIKVGLKSKKRKRNSNTENLLKKFSLQIEYILDRIEHDEPGGGLLIIESDENRSTLAGFLMFAEFATWAKGFEWDESKNQLTNKLGGLDKHWSEDHWEIPQLCELSVLLSLGNGRNMMNYFLSQVREKYQYVILDALPSAQGFYKMFKFSRVFARSKKQVCQEHKYPSYEPYFHFRNDNESFYKEKPANLLALQTRKNLPLLQGKQVDVLQTSIDLINSSRPQKLKQLHAIYDNFISSKEDPGKIFQTHTLAQKLSQVILHSFRRKIEKTSIKQKLMSGLEISFDNIDLLESLYQAVEPICEYDIWRSMLSWYLDEREARGDFWHDFDRYFHSIKQIFIDDM